MPRDFTLNKVLIIGSGPIVIGQAAEFDYAGTQACKAISEEGIETILINSNPATIMTDNGIADKVYLEPITEDAVEQILAKERPEGVLAGFGGQTGLNLAMALDEKGVFEKYGAKLLGVNKESIHKAEDREAFKDLMLEIGEPIPPSTIATTMEECRAFVEQIGYPVIIRPAYTLGGTGGGIAHNQEELEHFCKMGMEKERHRADFAGKSRWLAGRKWSTRLSATPRITASSSAAWKTWTRWAFTRATVSS